MTAASNRKLGDSLPVILLIFLGLILRVYNFWRPPLWIDEYGTWWVVAADTWFEVIERTLKIQGQTPLYYLLVTAITKLAGIGTWQLRLLSIVFGTAMLGVIYPLAIKIFNHRSVALLSLAIFSLSEPLIWYSQIARPYALALFLSLVSFWAFVSLHETESKWQRILYVISTALTIYAHYVFGLIVIIQASYMMARRGYNRTILFNWIATILATALLLTPAIQNFSYLHSRRHTLDWVAALDSSSKVAYGIIYLLGGLSPIVVLATISAVGLVCFKRIEWPGAEIRQRLTLPLLWYTIPLILALLLPILLGVSLLQTRYLLFAYPAVYFLLARLMLSVTANRYHQWLPAAVFVISTSITVLLPALHTSRTFSRWPSQAWNNALTDKTLLDHFDGMVVAQIGFVEANQLVDNHKDPWLFSFLSWPLVATAPTLSAQNIAILPYRLTDRTQRYFDSLLEKAVKHSRICLVGDGYVLSQFEVQLLRDSNYSVTTRTDHGGNFKTLILERSR